MTIDAGENELLESVGRGEWLARPITFAYPRTRSIAGACLFLLLTAPAAVARQADVILLGARVLTQDPARPTAEAVAIAGDRVSAVGSNETVRRLAGPKTRLIDLRGAAVIPGLIDAHVHLLVAPEIVDELSLRNYERTTLADVMTGFISRGITTVRSTGDPLPYISDLRSRMDQSLAGPRVVSTGPIPSSPGGHPAVTVCQKNPFCRQGLTRELKDENHAREVVRELARAGVDGIKIVVDDVIARAPRLSDAIVGALVDETHRQGRRIMAHVTVADDLQTTQRLIDLGLDEFVHMPFNIGTASPDRPDALSVARMLADRKIPVTTTVAAFDGYRDGTSAERSALGFPYTAANRQSFEGMLKTVRLLADSGVTLVLGTDWFAGPVKLDDPRLSPGALTIQEMEVLRRAGLSTSQILAASTRHAAQALGLGDRVGTITVGKLADLVVLDGDVLEAFSALRRPVAVLKGGRVAYGALPDGR